jgi:hypothetical protein
MSETSVPFTLEEVEDLRYAKGLLERQSLTAKLSNIVGGPIESGLKMLPSDWTVSVNKAVRAALFKGLEVATMTILPGKQKKTSEFFHKVLVGASGGVGGAFGLPALMIELPISTTIMLRSIAEIAGSEGHDLGDAATRLSCLEVFALGGQRMGDGSDSAYFAVRAAMSKTVAEAAAYITEKGVIEKTAPQILRFISSIGARFGVVVSEQVAAKAVPVIGAAGGAVVNVMFMNHFQEMARGHFIVKRLEKVYGQESVRTVYDSLAVRIPKK